MYDLFNQWSKPISDIMKPVVPLKWSESSIYPGPVNFAGLIQEGKVNIIRGGLIAMRNELSAAESKSSSYKLDIDLVDGKGKQQIDADCVIFATGWRTGDYPFFTRDQLDELGLPLTYSPEKPPLREEQFKATDEASLSKVKDIFSMRDPPSLWQQAGYSARSVGRVAQQFAPYRLYRLMVPLSHLEERDIAFPGRLLDTCIEH
jgi:hypothetical protein